MTAEIAVLNKHAIALASDSAVTIAFPDGDKVFNSVNKLFMLSKFAPVGVMIYGEADFMNVPWEPLLKLYRSQLQQQRFPTVADYAADLLKFIHAHSLFNDHDRQQRAFVRRVRGLFERIRDAVHHFARRATPPINLATEVDNAILFQQYIFKDLEPLGVFPPSFVSDRSRLVGKIRDQCFSGIPLSRSQKTKLQTLVRRMFTLNYLPTVSGVVVAGFGEDEIYPSLIAMKLDAIYDGFLRHTASSEAVSEKNRAILLPFAQHDMVATFMNGVDPDLDRALDSSLKELMGAVQGNSDHFAQELGLNPAQHKKLETMLSAVGTVTVDMFRKKAHEYQQREHVRPVTTALAYLPKEELSELAESLVHLTSLKRRVALGTESVGGPIDVAVISKGDGFIWMKRKHYFSRDLNPYFMETYYK